MKSKTNSPIIIDDLENLIQEHERKDIINETLRNDLKQLTRSGLDTALLKITRRLYEKNHSENCIKKFLSELRSPQNRPATEREINRVIQKVKETTLNSDGSITENETGTVSSSPWPYPPEIDITTVRDNLKTLSIRPLSIDHLSRRSPQKIGHDLAKFISDYFHDIDKPVYLGSHKTGLITSIDNLIKNVSKIEKRGYEYLVCNPMKRKMSADEKKMKLDDGTPKYKNGGRCYEFASDTLDVVTYEADHLTTKEQAGVILYLSDYLPLVSVVSSGGKSLHATFSLHDLKSCLIVSVRALLTKLGADRSVLNPVSLTRLGGVVRKSSGKMQDVLYMDKTARTRTPPKKKLKKLIKRIDQRPLSKSSHFTTYGEICIKHSKPLTDVISGLLKESSLLMLQASSKAGKTWALLDLAYALTNGDEWMGFDCLKTKTLFVNLELHPQTITARIEMMGRELYSSPLLNNLRGVEKVSWESIAENIETYNSENIEDPIKCVILDPIYMMLNGASENDNSEVGELLKRVGRMMRKVGGAVVYSHHHSKGSKGGQSMIDRNSGAGAWARYADAILDLLPHEENYHYIVECVARCFEQPEKRVVKRNHQYRFEVVDGANVNATKKAGGSNSNYNAQGIVDILSKAKKNTMPQSELLKAIQKEFNVADTTSRDWVRKALSSGQIIDTGKKKNKSPVLSCGSSSRTP